MTNTLTELYSVYVIDASIGYCDKLTIVITKLRCCVSAPTFNELLFIKYRPSDVPLATL